MELKRIDDGEELTCRGCDKKGTHYHLHGEWFDAFVCEECIDKVVKQAEELKIK